MHGILCAWNLDVERKAASVVKRAHTGRRPGRTTTRELIEDTARKHFAERGYDRTSIRSIAQQAEVDPRLVKHFFGTKIELFLTVAHLAADPASVIETVITGDQAQAGRRLANIVVDILDDEVRRRPMLSMVRAATSAPDAAGPVRDFLTRNVLQPIAERLGADDADYRASLVMSQIVGFTIARYVIALEALGNRARDRVIADLAATFQRYLLGDLDPGPCRRTAQVAPVVVTGIRKSNR
jgi:AcrR family transcriptional regulator